MERKEKLWTRDFIWCCTANFFTGIVFYLLMTTLAVYVADFFHASPSMAGTTVGIFVIGSLLGRLFIGKYIEIIGRKKTTYFSFAGFFLLSIAYLLSASIYGLILIRFLHGITFGISNTCVSTVTMTMIPENRRGEGVAYYMLSPTIAMAVGPFLGIFLLQNYDYTIVFTICAACTFLCLVCMLLVNIEEIEIASDATRPTASAGIRLQDLLERRALPISFIMMIMAICYAGVIPFISSYSIELGLEQVAALFFVVYSVVLLLSRPIAGILFDRRGDNFVVYPAMLFAFLAFVMLTNASGIVLFLGSAAFLALGYGNLISTGQGIAIKAVPPGRYGMAISTYFFFMDAGVGIAPTLLGLLVPVGGYRLIYGLLAILVILAGCLYYFLHGRQYAQNRQAAGNYPVV